MPALTTSYAGLPHGFLYIYFVALVFAVAGVNSTYVYIAQSAALGLSISLTYLAVRKWLTPFGGLAFLIDGNDTNADDTPGPAFDPTDGVRDATPAGIAAVRAFLAQRFPLLAEAG
jgi:hypothetical protein